MCHYITCTLPASADLEALSPVIKQFRMGFTAQENAKVQAQLPPGERYLLGTGNYCDCGTALGCMHQDIEDTERAEERLERQVRKLMKKGWSKAKIERWKDQKSAALSARQDKSTEATPDAQTWLDFIRALLSSGHANRVGVLLHWYSGNVTTENIRLAGTVEQNITDVSADDLMRIEENVWYVFHT
jgi:hypothetical protein